MMVSTLRFLATVCQSGHLIGSSSSPINLLRPSTFTFVTCLIVVFATLSTLDAQTEGDTGYDYDAAYDDDEADNDESGYEPAFDVPIVNVTVVTGQTAVLPCSIDYLGKYKVAWLDYKSIPLTYEDRRVVDDFRFSVVRPYVKEWNLQIRDIKWEDQGQYRCTINTNPVKSKLVMLHVKVPAAIIDELSSDDTTVQEGDTVVLICNVTGVPRPEVQWFRRPAVSKMSDRESKTTCNLTGIPRPEIALIGEMIIIQNVSRYCDDIYECVASNGVPPSVSRQMRVTVEFKPEITLPNRRLGQGRGRETILECIITAYPQAVTYWEKDGKKVTSSSKHRIEAYDEGDNTLVLSLRINDLQDIDYGEYKCIASNSLGKDDEIMHLYEYAAESDEKQQSKIAATASSPSLFLTRYYHPPLPHSPPTPSPSKFSRNVANTPIYTSNRKYHPTVGQMVSGAPSAAATTSNRLIDCMRWKGSVCLTSIIISISITIFFFFFGFSSLPMITVL